MKYRLLDEETLGQMIEFLDDIQIEASKGKYKDDIDKINMCSYLISEIINANEAMEIDDEDDIEDIKDLKKGDGLFVDIPDLNDKDWNKMIEQLDAFFAGWEKSTNKKRRTNDKKQDQQEKKEKNDDLDEDYIPTLQDKFEQYYLEREYKKTFKEARTMNEMLQSLKLELPPEELN